MKELLLDPSLDGLTTGRGKKVGHARQDGNMGMSVGTVVQRMMHF